MRLSDENLGSVPSAIERFSYDRDAQAIGIVHFGIGAFHRAHQAWYTDLVMDRGDRDWAICGVSLRSRAVSDQLEPQRGLYTVTTRSAEAEAIRVVGAVREVLFASDESAAIVDRIADPACRIVSFTVTEKGYCRTENGDLDLFQAEQSFYPLVARALSIRAECGLTGITLLSCDNLAENGRVLDRLMRRWLSERHPGLLGWYESHCTTPSSMVDRIVPRATPRDIAALEKKLNARDEGAVFTEGFSQWVIEDRFANGRPRWESVGVQMVADVAPYETAKLRMLNGAHSLLAYAGLEAGYEFVDQAIADPKLYALCRTLMLDEACPTIVCAPEQDLEIYAADLLSRFANPALCHRLAQIAMDGSQKLPQRWLDTVQWHFERGEMTPAISHGFEAWRHHFTQNEQVDDPQQDKLISAAQAPGRGTFLDTCFGPAAYDRALWPHYCALREAFADPRC